MKRIIFTVLVGLSLASFSPAFANVKKSYLKKHKFAFIVGAAAIASVFGKAFWDVNPNRSQKGFLEKLTHKFKGMPEKSQKMFNPWNSGNSWLSFNLKHLALDVAVIAIIADIGYNLITDKPELAEKLYNQVFSESDDDDNVGYKKAIKSVGVVVIALIIASVIVGILKFEANVQPGNVIVDYRGRPFPVGFDPKLYPDWELRAADNPLYVEAKRYSSECPELNGTWYLKEVDLLFPGTPPIPFDCVE